MQDMDVNACSFALLLDVLIHLPVDGQVNGQHIANGCGC